MVNGKISDDHKTIEVVADIDEILAVESSRATSVLVIPQQWHNIDPYPMRFNFCLIAPLDWNKPENESLRWVKLSYDQWVAEYGRRPEYHHYPRRDNKKV